MTRESVERLLVRADLDRMTEGDEHSPSSHDYAEDVIDRGSYAMERWQKYRGEDALARGAEDPDADDAAWEVLACYGAIRRLRPALVAQSQGEELRESLEATVSRDWELLVEFGPRAGDPERWLSAARGWSEEADDSENNPEDAARRARLLLEGVDDSELVVWALRTSQERRAEPGAADATLRRLDAFAEGVERCVRWTVDAPEDFLAAAAWIRCAAGAIDPEVPEREPELALSALKFAPLLDAVQAAWIDAPASARVNVQEWRELAAALAADRPSEGRLERLHRILSALADDVRSAVQAPLGLPGFARVDLTAAPQQPGDGPRVDFRGCSLPWRAWMRLPEPRDATDEREVWLHVEGSEAGDRVALLGLERELAGEGPVRSAGWTLGELRAVSPAVRDRVPATYATLVLIRAGQAVDVGVRE